MPFTILQKYLLALVWFVVVNNYLQIDAFHSPATPHLIRRCMIADKLKTNPSSTHSIRRPRSRVLYETQGNLENNKVETSDVEVIDSTRFFLKDFLAQPIIEVNLAILVLLSSLVVALETLPNLPPSFNTYLVLIEDFVCGIFAVEYLARWYLSKFSLKHLFQPLVIIDLIAISPLILQTLSMLGLTAVDYGAAAGKYPRCVLVNLYVNPINTYLHPTNTNHSIGGVLVNLRLFRILRLQRALTDYETFKNFEIALGLSPSDAKPYQLQLARVVSSIFTLLSVASGLIYTAEHTVNPQIPDYFTAFYFGLTTLTTVGFGDITPVTAYGRIIVCGSILFGVAIIPAQAAALAEALLTAQKVSKEDIIIPSSITDSSSATDGGSSDDMVYGISSSLMVYGDNTNNTLEPTDTMMNPRTRDNNDNNGGGVNDRVMNVGVKPTGVFRTCHVCGSAPHRYDAVFCWGCGSPLPHDEAVAKAIAPKETTTTATSKTTQQVRTDQDILTSV